MPETRVVDDRTFCLGLDELYRTRMKEHERSELLECARAVATTLGIEPMKVPVGGYYAEDSELREYFLLWRALQHTTADREPEVTSLIEYRRLIEVAASGLFGRTVTDGELLPRGVDPLSAALERNLDWNIAQLTAAANEIAADGDDFSLVGLAARVRDPVLLAATRESAVLYAAMVFMKDFESERPTYVWQVSHDLAKHSKRFIDTFNGLFG